MKNSAILAAALLLLTVTARPCAAQERASDSCRKFVQSFYDWYKTLSDDERDCDYVLKKKPGCFSGALVQQLQQDSIDKKKVPGEWLGLDYDPFLGTDGIPAKRYVAEKVQCRGDSYLVNVHGLADGKKSVKPNVVPELKLNGKEWQFTNFHYQANDDLVKDLKRFRTQREQIFARAGRK